MFLDKMHVFFQVDCIFNTSTKADAITRDLRGSWHDKRKLLSGFLKDIKPTVLVYFHNAELETVPFNILYYKQRLYRVS